MKLSDLVSTQKTKKVGRLFPARWVVSFLGRTVSDEVKDRAIEQAVNDVRFAVEHRHDSFCWFDVGGDVHIVRAAVGGWEHVISGPEREGPYTSIYSTNVTFDEIKTLVRENWDIK